MTTGRIVLDVLRGKAAFPPPLWMMRQAGRYLPEYRETRKRAQTIGNAYIEIMTCVGALAGAALANTAAKRVLDGQLSVGGMVALSLFLTAALAPIPLLSSVLQRYLAARASFRTLSEPFTAPVRPEERANARACEDATGAVTLAGVSFTYPGTTRRVLHEVDLEIAAGATVAVVGPTGAGKSSIAKLVGRVYDPDAGAVLVGAGCWALAHSTAPGVPSIVALAGVLGCHLGYGAWCEGLRLQGDNAGTPALVGLPFRVEALAHLVVPTIAYAVLALAAGVTVSATSGAGAAAVWWPLAMVPLLAGCQLLAAFRSLIEQPLRLLV